MLINNTEIANLKDLENFLEKSNEDNLLLLYFYNPADQSCQIMLSVIEKIAAEYEQLIFAKVNVTSPQTQQLLTQFRIKNLPTLLFVHDKKLVKQLAGAQSEEALEQYIEALLPPPSQEIQLYDQVKLMFAEERYAEAYEYASVLYSQNPQNNEYLILLIRSAFRINQFDQLVDFINLLPETFINDKNNLNLLLANIKSNKNIPQISPENIQDIKQKIQYACLCLLKGKYETACEVLLKSIAFDKQYEDALAKKLLLAILFVMGPTKATIEYRKKLTNIMFI